MNASTLARILAVVGLAVVALFGAGCKNSETPAAKCECPDKIHGSEPCACGGVDCACEQKEYALAHNVTVINETGEKLRAGLIDDITAALNALSTSESLQFTFSDASARNPKVILANTINGDQIYEIIDRNTVKLRNQFLEKYSTVEVALEQAFEVMLQNYTTMNTFISYIRLASPGAPAPFFAGNGSSKRKSLQAPICPALAGPARTFFWFPA
jgi:hypothetical protein